MSDKYIYIDIDENELEDEKKEYDSTKEEERGRRISVIDMDTPAQAPAPAPAPASTSSSSQIHSGHKNVITIDDEVDEKVPFTFDEFEDMWIKVENKDFGTTLEQMENSSMVRKANHKAMYGRITCTGLAHIFDVMDLKSSDIFLDLGHGLGLPSIQAAYTRGCEARGIELEKERFCLSEQCMEAMERQRELKRQEHIEYKDNLVGKIDFRVGDLTSPEHSDFILSANKVLVNNAKEIFASRCNQKFPNNRMLDDYIAGIFARLKPGSIMVTCEPLTCLGRSVSEENEVRQKVGLSHDPSASFFEYEGNVEVGNHSTTWGGDLTNLYVWVYRRTSSLGFLCSSIERVPCFEPKTCPGNNLTTNICGDGVEYCLVDKCAYCDCTRRIRFKRGSQKKQDPQKKNEAVQNQTGALKRKRDYAGKKETKRNEAKKQCSVANG